jgi:hypothetical protein
VFPGDAGRVAIDGYEVFVFELRKVVEDFCFGHAGGELAEHILNGKCAGRECRVYRQAYLVLW